MDTNSLLSKIQFLPKKCILNLVQKINEYDIEAISYIGFSYYDELDHYFFIVKNNKSIVTFLTIQYKKTSKLSVISFGKNKIENFLCLGYVNQIPQSSNEYLNSQFKANNWILNRHYQFEKNKLNIDSCEEIKDVFENELLKAVITDKVSKF